MKTVLRPFIALALGALLPFLSSAQAGAEKISPELQAEIEAQQQGLVPVLMMLADRVDVPAMEESFRRRRATMEERSYELLTALQAKAAATQPPVLALLQGLPGVTQIQPFWIMNAIAFHATPEAIVEISRHPAIEWIDIDSPVYVEDEAETFVPAPAGIDRVENGLVLIGAPEMWAMGYSGYGRKALIVDTGTDAGHPALHNQFAFHYQPLNEVWSGQTAPEDCGNHGSHVTGTVLGIDRITRDTIGVAYGAKWMSGIALGGDCRPGTSVSGITGMLQWAVDPDGNPATIDDRPDVINNSWRSGSPNCGNPNIRELYDALYAVGIAVIFSAGNEGPEPQTITMPKVNNWDLVRLFAVGNLNGNNPNLPIANSSSRGPSICGGTGSILIKPEVSAPGTSVRSSVPGGYGNLSGTSMASPHVAGAVLLLKEAFPDLTGEELMLALYFTCIDLGEPGEDNDYGMGLINVPAAFEYLLNEGHEPVPPTIAPNDITLLRASFDNFNCSLSAAPALLVEHNGTDTIHALTIQMRVEGLPDAVLEHEWEGLLLPKERQTIDMPGLQLPAGLHTIEVEVIAVNGQPDARSLDNRLKQEIRVIEEEPLSATLVGDVQPCSNGTAVAQLLTDDPGRVRWYSAATGGVLLGQGPTLAFNVANEPRTVYAQLSPSREVGRAIDAPGNPQLSAAAQGLVFDALVPLRIKSVKVYAEQAGNRLISLVNENGGATNRVVAVPAGESRIDLDFNIQPGRGQRLELRGGLDLRFTVGPSGYPYRIPNVLSITRSTGSILQYFYFYEWEIEYDYFCGRSPVTVEPLSGQAPQTAFSPAQAELDLSSGSNEISFVDESTGATAWLWSFGDGTFSTAQNPVHAYEAAGTYLVTLTTTGTDGCSNSASGTVAVTGSLISSTSFVPEIGAMTLFPNPAQDIVFVAFELERPAAVALTLFDVLGRPVLRRPAQQISGQETLELSLQGLPTGTYVLVADMGDGRIARRLVKR
jgi:hypothetical protein